MRHAPLAALLCSALLLAAPAAQAKDLRNRFGVGFTEQIGGFPSIALRYGLPMPNEVMNLQVELAAGFLADGDATTTDGVSGGARLLYALVAEDNMNLYAEAGLGWNSIEGANALRIQPGLGVQFFFFGLENLGISADWGICIDLGKPTGIATWSSAPGLGLHYYF
ncbi:MAG: hypothetical protein ABIO70_09270 [Pseudomonadota bacterium]